MFKKIAHFSLLLAFVFSLSGLVLAQDTTRLRIALNTDEGINNPYVLATGYPGWNMTLLQFDTLYQLDVDGVPQPWLVTETTVSDDGLTITLDLREDVTWHDGEAFTAEDVVFTIDYYGTHTHPRFTRAVTPIASAEADGDYRVILNMARLFPSIEISTFADMPILPQHIWSEIENPNAEDVNYTLTQNTGTGPYQLVEYEPNQFYRLEANPDYFGGAPQVDELVFIVYASLTGSIAAIQADEVDMIVESVPPEQVDLLGLRDDIDIIQGPLFTTEMLIYDVDRFPFQEAAVREAISLAIDREDLIETVYLGTATSGNIGWTHPASPFYNDTIETLYSPDDARALLDDAGIVDSDGDGIRELDGQPLSFELLAQSSESLRVRKAELISEMLLEIGIEAQVNVLDPSVLGQAVWPGANVAAEDSDYEMSMWGWSAPVQSDTVRVTALLHSDPSIGFFNLTDYASEEADMLSEDLLATIDAQRQIEILGDIQATIAEDLPFIMLLYPDGLYAYRPAVYDGWLFMTGQGIFHKLSLIEQS